MVGFCSSIRNSKIIKKSFSEVIESLKTNKGNDFKITADHVDGNMHSIEKNNKIDNLKSSPQNKCHLLTNAKCLTEGVDIPSLDAVIFFNPKKSPIEIIQAIGRVMRKHEEKEHGYIIIPVIIPHGEDPEKALDNNKIYGVVWQVLKALKAHDPSGF